MTDLEITLTGGFAIYGTISIFSFTTYGVMAIITIIRNSCEKENK